MKKQHTKRASTARPFSYAVFLTFRSSRPRLCAAVTPWFQRCSTSRTRASFASYASAISRLPSVEPSSTRTISKSRNVCARILSRHTARYGATLYTGTITEISGLSVCLSVCEIMFHIHPHVKHHRFKSAEPNRESQRVIICSLFLRKYRKIFFISRESTEPVSFAISTDSVVTQNFVAPGCCVFATWTCTGSRLSPIQK